MKKGFFGALLAIALVASWVGVFWLGYGEGYKDGEGSRYLDNVNSVSSDLLAKMSGAVIKDWEWAYGEYEFDIGSQVVVSQLDFDHSSSGPGYSTKIIESEVQGLKAAFQANLARVERPFLVRVRLMCATRIEER